ncbi:MAG: hypothetical protein MJ252_04620 [archaeon]|nr:hypothetical protein [archaeon]
MSTTYLQNQPSSREKEILNELGGLEIPDLYKELERKDLVIKNLQNQLYSSKNQTDILVSAKEQENNTKETNLRSQLFQKDNTIKEKEDLISSLKNELSENQKKIIDLKTENTNLNQEINNMKITLQNYQLRFNAKEEEMNKNSLKLTNNITTLQTEKKSIEAKSAQLVEIIKQYSKELNESSIHIDSIEQEKKSLETINQKLNEKNDENMNVIKQLKKELNKVQELYNQNEKLTNANLNLNKDFEDLKYDYEKIMKEKSEDEIAIQQLSFKLNELNTLKQSYADLNDQFIESKSKINELEIANKIHCDRANTNELEYNTLSKKINKDIALLVEWIETYFGVYFDKEIAEYPKSEVSNIINFPLIEKTLKNKRDKINLKMAEYEKTIESNEEYIKELLNNLDKLQSNNNTNSKQLMKEKENSTEIHKQLIYYKNEIDELTEEVTKLKDDNYRLTNDLNLLNDTLDKTLKNEFKELLNNKNLTERMVKDNLYLRQNDKIENKLNSLISLVDLLVKEYENKLTLLNENSSLISQIGKLNNEILLMNKGHIDEMKEKDIEIQKNKEAQEKALRDKLRETNEKNDKENMTQAQEIEYLKNNIKLLEKRINNIQTEMDLKDIQIKSQEEIINRRNRLKTNESQNDSKTVIKSLEDDKEKLINDNMLLISDNRYLKEQLDIVSNELAAIKGKSK